MSSDEVLCTRDDPDVVEFDQLSSGFVYEYNTKILEDLAHNKALHKPVMNDATQGKQFDLISGVACRQ